MPSELATTACCASNASSGATGVCSCTIGGFSPWMFSPVWPCALFHTHIPTVATTLTVCGYSYSPWALTPLWPLACVPFCGVASVYMFHDGQQVVPHRNRNRNLFGRHDKRECKAVESLPISDLMPSGEGEVKKNGEEVVLSDGTKINLSDQYQAAENGRFVLRNVMRRDSFDRGKSQNLFDVYKDDDDDETTNTIILI